MIIAIASSTQRGLLLKDLLKNLKGYQIHLIEDKDSLSVDNLNKIKPKYVFFPHWSHIIPKEIYENFECVIFHMTDLPFGRGGSPLQNLITRKIYETQISALRCTKGLDEGPVYIKKPFSLYGSAEEIYIRALRTIKDEIVEITSKSLKPQEQKGVPEIFERRKPNQSDISNLENLEGIFDYIRMLDADGYPKAFIEKNKIKLEFSRASLKTDSIIADVKITIKK